MKHFRRNDRAQLHVVEAIIVGIMVFTILSVTAIFRLPTTPATFQQSELERLAHDALDALAAKPPPSGVDCNEPAPCPFSSDLERVLSLSLGYAGATPAGEIRDTSALSDYLNQSLPDGTRYIASYSNGANTTTIYPLNLVPPALDVSVGHHLLAPNWTEFSDQFDDSVVIRIGELTNFDSDLITSISDPLNRGNDEWGESLIDLFSDSAADTRVDVGALFGTYELCPTVGSCAYFSVVPPGVFDAGSFILLGDRDNSSGLTSLGSFYSYAKLYDNVNNNVLDLTEAAYLDVKAPFNQVTAGDLRLTAVAAPCDGTEACRGGSWVEAGQSDIGRTIELFSPLGSEPKVRSLVGDDDGELDEDEYIYWDIDQDGADLGRVSEGDWRLTRVGTLAFGSNVTATSSDIGLALETGADEFSNLAIMWADANTNAAVDVGESLYLDLTGNGQTTGLESLDLHLNPKGSPTVRYIYDIKLVVWFGI